MLLKIRNFGPIQNCDIDLSKNITLIVGQNNIGKSYAISLVYVLLKVMSRRPDPRLYGGIYYREFHDSKILGKWLDEIASEVEAAKNGDDIDITKGVETQFAYSLKHLSRSATGRSNRRACLDNGTSRGLPVRCCVLCSTDATRR
jgi:AAA15 family ATPase/GTPase